MRRRLIEKYSRKGMETALDKKTAVESRRKKKPKKETVAKKREARQQLSPPLPSAILSPRLFLFCPVLTWKRRGFRVRSAAAVASTSLPALRDRSVGGTTSTPCQTLGWRRLFPNIGVKRGQNPIQE